jgi:hypothetical protein
MPLRHRVSIRTERPRPAGDEGFVMSSPLALMSAAAVMLAGVAFLATDRDTAVPEQQAAVLATTAKPTERPVTLEKVKPTKKPEPVVKRTEIYVSVYNNSNITGLAGSTAARIGGAGWQVTGSDNWYGTIPATTIYYPPNFKDAAELLSDDIGVQRLMPAVDPMSMDRLTVILTADFA